MAEMKSRMHNQSYHIFNMLSSPFTVLVFKNRHADSNRNGVRERKQRGRVRRGRGKYRKATES